MATEVFTNQAQTIVVSGGTTAPAAGTTESWIVASASQFPAAVTGVTQFHVCDSAAPSEIIVVTGVFGAQWTVTRGAESTTPVPHAAGFTAYQVTTAGFLNSVVTPSGTATAGYIPVATGSGEATAWQAQPPAGVQVAGDIGGTTGSPQVTGTHLASPMPLAQGGTAVNAASNPALLTALGAAPLASPALSGTPTAPTATAGTSTTQLATTAFTTGAVATGVAAAESASTLALAQTSVKTANYTALANQLVPVSTASGPVTVTLPNAPPGGTLLAVKMVTQAGTNTVTVACAGSDVFNVAGGSASGTLKLLSQGMLLEYNSGIWLNLADDLPLSQLDLRYDILGAAAAAQAADLPLPGGTATAGRVPVATGTGSASNWGTGNSDWLNVKNPPFNAAGNGTTDDTAALQAALAAADAAGGGTVYLPVGQYLINNPLQVWHTAITTQWPGPSLIGAACAGRIGDNLTDTSSAVQLVCGPLFPTGQFVIDYRGNQSSFNGAVAGFTLAGFGINCNSLGAGIRCWSVRRAVVRDISMDHPATPTAGTQTLQGADSGAVSFVSGGNAAAYNCVENVAVAYATQDSFAFSDNGNDRVINCWSLNPTRYGFQCNGYAEFLSCHAEDAGSADYNIIPLMVTISNSDLWGVPRGNAIRITPVASDTLQGLAVTGCLFSGALSGSLTEQNGAIVNITCGAPEPALVVFSGCNFVSRAATTDYVYVSTNVQGTVLFDGCNFEANPAPTTNKFNVNASTAVTFKGCPGINPAGSVTVAVPATTVPTAALPYDATYYITAGASGTTTVAISGGPTITIPASAMAPVLVPANKTLTPVYTSAPTWVVEGN